MGTPSPRSTEGTHPGRVSAVWNVTTPSGSGWRPGKPTAREAQLSGGHWMVQQANAGGRKATGNRDERLLLPVAVSHNWPDTGSCLARKGADVDQVSH